MSGVNADKKLGLVQSTVSKSTSPTTIDIFMHATPRTIPRMSVRQQNVGKHEMNSQSAIGLIGVP